MISEIETAGSSDASAAAVGNPGQSDLLEVTFQKNPNQKFKFLEAEPKILGVTEIMLTILCITSKNTYFPHNIFTLSMDIACACVGIIAGSVAIAAQNLHLPTLKACLGMQIVTSLTYGFILIISVEADPFTVHPACWGHNETYDEQLCNSLMTGFSQIEAMTFLMQAVQVALSITLAAYCCKVIQCCSPRSHMPVIVMKPPRASD